MTMEDVLKAVPDDDTPDGNKPEDCDDAAVLTCSEFASLPGEETELVHEQVALPTPRSSVSPVNVHDHVDEVPRKASVRQPGDQRTGTFHATALLIATEPFERTAAHDLESFCWVIIYAAYKRALLDAEGNDKEALQAENDRLFSISSVAMLIERRTHYATPYILRTTSSGTQRSKAIPHHAVVGLVEFWMKEPCLA
ncbi:hypothetical protein GY45DRAFT_1151189 [Cubamyces sp. BRFM 1775]|nr:hypothetical protein GY45DRAFT_1151189 [Cubamyces sp. BRFM 1775]